MKKILAFLLITLLLTTTIPFKTPGTVSETPLGLQVHFLDVSQGDCAVVLCDGEAMVIDGGPRSASQYVYSYITDTLNLRQIDYLVVTHPHLDHIGGVSSVLNAVQADLILTSVTEWNSKAFSSFLEYAGLQGAPIVVPNEGESLQLGGATITILHCWPEAVQYSRTNDASIVLRIEYGTTSFLFTGDAEDWSEYMMLDDGANLKADVLKVSHHGSSTASTEEFLEAVQPEYAVVSVGKNNDYGHPHKDVLDRLSAMKCKILRTDRLGTIVMESDGENIKAMP